MKRFMNLISWHKLLTLGLLFIILLAFGCSKKDTEGIKIGCITPLSGEGATYGEATKRGIDLAIEEINNKNGINGKVVQVIYVDDQMKPQIATNASRYRSRSNS